MQFSRGVEYVLKVEGLDVYCIIGFGCSEKNKRLQCKAKKHISERPYFSKTTVFPVSFSSLCGLLLVNL